jgi:DNA-binding NarL/FixJ family response regulator
MVFKRMAHIVRVLLVDDHTMVRDGLRSVLEGYDDIDVAGVASDGEEAVHVVDKVRPQVVLMDINMPKMNGITATAHIKARHPRMIVVGISVNADDEHRNAMINAGAVSLISKEAAIDQLHEAIVGAVSRSEKES